jgi:PIN domain-containing protein
MPNRALVLDANIPIRAVLGVRVRRILETFTGRASFFVSELALSEAQDGVAPWGETNS